MSFLEENYKQKCTEFDGVFYKPYSVYETTAFTVMLSSHKQFPLGIEKIRFIGLTFSLQGFGF